MLYRRTSKDSWDLELVLIGSCPDYRSWIEMTKLGLNIGVLNREVYSRQSCLLLGKFRTSIKTITNTSSLWVRASKSWRHLRSSNQDRLPFLNVQNEHNFVNFLRFVDMFPLKMQNNLIIWVLWNRYICILSMGLSPTDANNLLNRAVIFVLIQLKSILYA
jgi:hypothetical protein